MLHPNEIILIEPSNVNRSGYGPTSAAIEVIVDIVGLAEATGVAQRKFNDALGYQIARQRREFGYGEVRDPDHGAQDVGYTLPGSGGGDGIPRSNEALDQR